MTHFKGLGENDSVVGNVQANTISIRPRRHCLAAMVAAAIFFARVSVIFLFAAVINRLYSGSIEFLIKVLYDGLPTLVEWELDDAFQDSCEDRKICLTPIKYVLVGFS